MGVSYGRSRTVDITFQVFGRVIHPDWFQVRAHRRIQGPDWEADVRLIEGGHVIHWGSGRGRLTEILVGPETPLPELGLLYQAPVRFERSATLRQGDRASYQTCFDVEHLEPEVFDHLCDELVVDASKGLFHRYPPLNRLEPGAISFLRCDARANGLSVQAFHTYPEERAIVRTQSLFELFAKATTC